MKDITIGACDWALPGNGLYATAIAASAGLETISLKIGLHENDYPLTQPQMQKIYLEEQQKYGISYCAVALNDFDNIPMHARKGSLFYETVWDLLARSVKTAKALQVPMIQVPAFLASEIKTGEDMEMSAKALQYLCDLAGEADIRVASENVLDAAHFKELYERVNRPNFYLYFDSQNYELNCGYKESEILDELYPYMCDQLHVKDGDEVMSGGLLGTGTSEFYDTISALDAHDYSGMILLENYYDVYPLRTVKENPYDILAEDIRILKDAVNA